MPRARQASLLMALVVIAVLLAARLAGYLDDPAPVQVVTPVDATGGEATDLPEIPRWDPPPLARFAPALDRPLFAPDRRPPPVGAEAEPEPRQALIATLQGVMLSGTERRALIRPGTGDQVVRLKEGDLLQGWRLEEIGPDHVLFRRDDDAVTLDLLYKADTGGRPGVRE